MTTDDKIRDEKLQYDINREATKILVLSSGRSDKYEFLTGEETYLLLILLSEKLLKNNQKRLKSKKTDRRYYKAKYQQLQPIKMMIIKIIIKKLLKNQFDEIKELTNEINQNDHYIILKIILLDRDLMISIMT